MYLFCFNRLYFQSTFRFTAKLSRKSRDLPCILGPCVSRYQQHPSPEGTFVTINEIGTDTLLFTTKSCPTLCNPIGCSTPKLLCLSLSPRPAQIHVHSVGDFIQPSCPLTPSCLHLPIRSFSPISQLFARVCQNIGALVSAMSF